MGSLFGRKEAREVQPLARDGTLHAGERTAAVLDPEAEAPGDGLQLVDEGDARGAPRHAAGRALTLAAPQDELPVLPSPAAHSISAALKAGETSLLLINLTLLNISKLLRRHRQFLALLIL